MVIQFSWLWVLLSNLKGNLHSALVPNSIKTSAETNPAAGSATTNVSQVIQTLETLDQKLELGARGFDMGCPQ